MRKKHFEALASALSEIKPDGASQVERSMWEQACHVVANACADFNEAFDYNRFMIACGNEDYTEEA